jgi:hypothetical protein
MSQPESPSPEVVEPASPALGQRCTQCGARFELGDTLIWLQLPGLTNSAYERPTATAVHVRCVPGA